MIIQKIKNAKTKIKNSYECYCRRKKLRHADFSIISNNCWGGFIYQMFGLEYTSPTIGLFIMEKDYVRFLGDLKHYLSLPLEFIDITESKYYDALTNSGAENISYPIARLDDVEVFFMHYKSREEAEEKWNRRKNRINYDRLFVKMSQRTDCDDETVKNFSELCYENKICFTQSDYPYKDCTTVKELKGLVGDETDLTLKYFDIYQALNKIS